MKLDTAAIVAKAICFVVIGFFTPLVTGLAQWANSGEWPGRIVWVVMGASCCIGGATQLLSFLSNSYSEYAKGRNGQTPLDDSHIQLPPPESQPKTETPKGT